MRQGIPPQILNPGLPVLSSLFASFVDAIYDPGAGYATNRNDGSGSSVTSDGALCSTVNGRGGILSARSSANGVGPALKTGANGLDQKSILRFDPSLTDPQDGLWSALPAVAMNAFTFIMVRRMHSVGAGREFRGLGAVSGGSGVSGEDTNDGMSYSTWATTAEGFAIRKSSAGTPVFDSAGALNTSWCCEVHRVDAINGIYQLIRNGTTILNKSHTTGAAMNPRSLAIGTKTNARFSAPIEVAYVSWHNGWEDNTALNRFAVEFGKRYFPSVF